VTCVRSYGFKHVQACRKSRLRSTQQHAGNCGKSSAAQRCAPCSSFVNYELTVCADNAILPRTSEVNMNKLFLQCQHLR
jgi:hypothetical protein